MVKEHVAPVHALLPWYQNPIDTIVREALVFMKNNEVSSDVENSHYLADLHLCDILRAYGHDDVVDAFLKMDKWYA